MRLSLVAPLSAKGFNQFLFDRMGKKEKATESEMRTFAERWRPYRGLALVYCYAELIRRRAEQ